MRPADVAGDECMRRLPISDFDLYIAVEVIYLGHTAKVVAFSLGHAAGTSVEALPASKPTKPRHRKERR